jgi:hypothetical protein
MQPEGNHINLTPQACNLLTARVKRCIRAYSFLFNGQESDNEVFNSTGASYTAQFWQYDSRIGRRWNLDPKPNPSISYYATFAGNPVWYSDPLGNSATVFITGDDESANEDATKQLQSSTNLKLSRNKKTGQITATGKAKNADDKKLLEDYADDVETNFTTLTLKEMGFSKELTNFISTLSLNNQSKIYSQIMEKVDEDVKKE